MATQYQRRTFPFVLEKFTSAQQFKKTPISRSDFRLVCHKGFVQAFELRRIAVFPSVNTLMKTSATLTGFEPAFELSRCCAIPTQVCAMLRVRWENENQPVCTIRAELRNSSVRFCPKNRATRQPQLKARKLADLTPALPGYSVWEIRCWLIAGRVT